MVKPSPAAPALLPAVSARRVMTSLTDANPGTCTIALERQSITAWATYYPGTGGNLAGTPCFSTSDDSEQAPYSGPCSISFHAYNLPFLYQSLECGTLSHVRQRAGGLLKSRCQAEIDNVESLPTDS